MEQILQETGMDESFKRPGSIPFKWEIQPGIPKPHHTDSNDLSTDFFTKLSPPPYMASPSPTSTILYSAPPSAISRSSSSQSTTLFYRSASDSQSKRRVHPAVRPSPRARVLAPQVTAVPPGCFQMAVPKRKDDKARVISQSNIDVIYRSVRPLGKSLPSREALAGTSRWLF